MSADITKFEINSMRPFATHSEAAEQCLNSAHALSTVLSDSVAENHRLLGELNEQIQADMFRGIAALVAYAQYHLQQEARGAQS